MKPELIVTDWNGTLIEDLDDSPVMKQIAMDELFHCSLTLRLKRAWKLAETRKKLKETINKYKEAVKNHEDDPESHTRLLRQVYDLYGTEVICGIPLGRIGSSLESYGEKSRKRLILPLIDAIAGSKNMNDSKIGILTSALYEGVRACLGNVTADYFDFIVGSRIKKTRHGKHGRKEKAVGIDLRNYDDKSDKLIEIMGEYGISPDNVVYIGDDFRDEPCIEHVGRFVVSPIATDEYKHRIATEYGKSKVRTPSLENNDIRDAIMLD